MSDSPSPLSPSSNPIVTPSPSSSTPSPPPHRIAMTIIVLPSESSHCSRVCYGCTSKRYHSPPTYAPTLTPLPLPPSSSPSSSCHQNRRIAHGCATGTYHTTHTYLLHTHITYTQHSHITYNKQRGAVTQADDHNDLRTTPRSPHREGENYATRCSPVSVS
jgi:hypothetical protein